MSESEQCAECGQSLRLTAQAETDQLFLCWTCHPLGKAQIAKPKDQRVKHWIGRGRRK